MALWWWTTLGHHLRLQAPAPIRRQLVLLSQWFISSVSNNSGRRHHRHHHRCRSVLPCDSVLNFHRSRHSTPSNERNDARVCVWVASVRRKSAVPVDRVNDAWRWKFHVRNARVRCLPMLNTKANVPTARSSYARTTAMCTGNKCCKIKKFNPNPKSI